MGLDCRVLVRLWLSLIADRYHLTGKYQPRGKKIAAPTSQGQHLIGPFTKFQPLRIQCLTLFWEIPLYNSELED